MNLKTWRLLMGLLSCTFASAQEPVFENQVFKLEALGITITGNVIRVQVRLTNLLDNTLYGFIEEPGNLSNAYLVDGEGNRCPYKAAGELANRRTFPGKIPIKDWISFSGPDQHSGVYHMYLRLKHRPGKDGRHRWETSEILIRNIPVD